MEDPSIQKCHWWKESILFERYFFKFYKILLPTSFNLALDEL